MKLLLKKMYVKCQNQHVKNGRMYYLVTIIELLRFLHFVLTVLGIIISSLKSKGQF